MARRKAISTLVEKRLEEMNLNADDVLRKALNIKASGITAEGAFFPEGTYFIVFYNEELFYGLVIDGAIVMKHSGNSFTSVSGAAADVTGRPTTNGWAFWSVRMPGRNEVRPIASFRDK